MFSFLSMQHRSQPWRPVVRTYPPPIQTSSNSPRFPILPPSIVNTLQNRSLTENDYELLLQLESNTTTVHSGHTDSNSGGVRSEEGQVPNGRLPERVINSFHVEPVDSGSHLLQNGGATCEMCTCVYRRGDWIRKLPCKHKVHAVYCDSSSFFSITTVILSTCMAITSTLLAN